MIPFPPALQSPPPRAPAHAGLRHTVLVRSEEPGSPLLNLGSGVVVAPGLVATNAHVVMGGGGIQIHQGDRSWPARLQSVDLDRDLALLEVQALGLQPATLTSRPPEDGASLTYLGYPGGKGPVTRTGHLRGSWSYLGDRLLEVDIELSAGASGGGLFNTAGELVGLATFQLRGRPRVVFALPSAWIRARLAQPDPDPGMPGGGALQDRFVAQMAQEPANRERWRSFAEAWVREAPGDPDAHVALGHALAGEVEALREEGSLDEDRFLRLSQEARAARARALSLRRDRARDWHNLGVTLDQENRFTEALDAHREAVRLQADYAPGWEGLGATLFNLRQFATSRSALLEAARLAPDTARTWGLLATCESTLGRQGEALAHYRIALRYRPFHAPWWEAFGRSALACRRAGEAEEALLRLQALAPERARELGKAMKGKRN
ncbi:MAG TPA: tetratricopeptide repeat-containing serine protease family protein [Holophagaceae bacterium]|nr:tetratricopeptide repeat-containing serine protease family protein [Holophagaceae bacterium]